MRALGKWVQSWGGGVCWTGWSSVAQGDWVFLRLTQESRSGKVAGQPHLVSDSRARGRVKVQAYQSGCCHVRETLKVWVMPGGRWRPAPVCFCLWSLSRHVKHLPMWLATCWPPLLVGIEDQAGARRARARLVETDMGRGRTRTDPLMLMGQPGRGRKSDTGGGVTASWEHVSQLHWQLLQPQPTVHIPSMTISCYQTISFVVAFKEARNQIFT